ncbi:MAG: hypothetical protein HQL07_06200 [Nitrospirae bacterium]|nr:hypothetical protein [Magnetococcales bacterium]
MKIASLIFLILSWWHPMNDSQAESQGSPLPSESEPSQQELSLGRLFNTPANRVLLDQRRLTLSPDGDTKSVEDQAEDISLPGVKGPRYLSVTGLIFNENGERKLWLNGKIVEATKTYDGEGFSVDLESATNKGLPVSSVDTHENYLVKPGQTVDFVKKRITATWEIPESERASARREPPPSAQGAKASGGNTAGDTSTPPSDPKGSSATNPSSASDPFQGLPLSPGVANALKVIQQLKANQSNMTAPLLEEKP